MQPRKIKRYGWVPDLPDMRDHLYASVIPPADLPPNVNLHHSIYQVYDQLELGSCTANAIGQAIMMDFAKQKTDLMIPSRLFIYYNERVIEDSVNDDSGAQIRDGIKTLAAQGVCSELLWPYDEGQFATKPSDSAYTDALNHKAVRYARLIPIASQLKGCLTSGFPFVFGMSVYDSFESYAVTLSGNVPLPQTNETVIGGHALIAIGYNDGADIPLSHNQIWPKNTFLIQNSWGKDWGLKSIPGCFTIPYAYLTDTNLSDDFWVIRLMGQDK